MLKNDFWMFDTIFLVLLCSALYLNLSISLLKKCCKLLWFWFYHHLNKFVISLIFLQFFSCKFFLEIEHTHAQAINVFSALSISEYFLETNHTICMFYLYILIINPFLNSSWCWWANFTFLFWQFFWNQITNFNIFKIPYNFSFMRS